MVTAMSLKPNPVMFSYWDVIYHRELPVAVDWSTSNPRVQALLYRSVNGAEEKLLPGKADDHGHADDNISLGQELTFIVRNAVNREYLGSDTVFTSMDPLAAYLTDPDLDFIYGLSVDAKADTIGLAFRTKKPAVPYVEIRRHGSGELADSWGPGGIFQQQHQNVFNGFGAGLPQDTKFDIRIVALKDVGGGRVSIGSGARNPEIRGTVTTGARTVSFRFDLIHVRNDGDPAGAGEFTFTFGVGDVITQQRLGPVESYEDDIPAGYDRDVNKTITVEHAPRWMWAQVAAWEDDTGLGDLLGHPGGLGIRSGLVPGFAPPGSDGFERDEGSFARVTDQFDTDEIASGREPGFRLATGNFSIAYDVFGSVKVTRRPGKSSLHVPRRPQLGRRTTERMTAHSAVLLAGRTQTVGGTRGFTAVGLGPDGAVILRAVDAHTGAGSATDLGGRFDTSVTLVASPHDTLHVLGMTSEGGVVTRTVTSGPAPDAGWTELGGAFTGVVTGVARGPLVDVLAYDSEGRAFHRVLPTGQESDGDWTRLGGRVAAPVGAVGTPAGDLAVFGLDPGGRIVHKRLTSGGNWTPGHAEWDVLCAVDDRTAAQGTIDVLWATDKDVIVSVFVDDDLAGALLWRNYPEPDRDLEWMAVDGADHRL